MTVDQPFNVYNDIVVCLSRYSLVLEVNLSR